MTPKLTYTIARCRAYFTRCGYQVSLWNADGSPHAVTLRFEHTCNTMQDAGPFRFYGNDGRKVRGEAISWARLRGAEV